MTDFDSFDDDLTIDLATLQALQADTPLPWPTTSEATGNTTVIGGGNVLVTQLPAVPAAAGQSIGPISDSVSVRLPPHSTSARLCTNLERRGFTVLDANETIVEAMSGLPPRGAFTQAALLVLGIVPWFVDRHRRKQRAGQHLRLNIAPADGCSVVTLEGGQHEVDAARGILSEL
jgi:hypothetical protein